MNVVWLSWNKVTYLCILKASLKLWMIEWEWWWMKCVISTSFEEPTQACSWTDPPRAYLRICSGLMLRHALQKSSLPSNRWAGSRRRQRGIHYCWYRCYRDQQYMTDHSLYTFLQNISTLTYCVVGVNELMPTKFNVLVLTVLC